MQLNSRKPTGDALEAQEHSQRHSKVLRVARKLTPTEWKKNSVGHRNFLTAATLVYDLFRPDGSPNPTAIVGPVQSFTKLNRCGGSIPLAEQVPSTEPSPLHTEEPTAQPTGKLDETEDAKTPFKSESISQRLLNNRDGRSLLNYSEFTKTWGRISANLAHSLAKHPGKLLLNCGQKYREKLEAAELIEKVTPLHQKAGDRAWATSLRTQKNPRAFNESYVCLGSAFSGVYGSILTRPRRSGAVIRAPFSAHSVFPVSEYRLLIQGRRVNESSNKDHF